MCCLFGLMDIGHNFNGRQKAKILSTLARECELRGTDATGIAYQSGGKLRIYKRPTAARNLKFIIPRDAAVIMGHTRLTTQGSEKKNWNNHPFYGVAGTIPFALAHNGVLYNDQFLRKRYGLPQTKIETDSYIAVQLLAQQKALTPETLRYMAEHVEGSFSFTVLDAQQTLYFVKGDNPLCLYYFPNWQLYLYASTEEILQRALRRMLIPLGKLRRVELSCGDLLCIGVDGTHRKGTFDASHLFSYGWPNSWRVRTPYTIGAMREYVSDAYLEDLKSVAGYYGYSPEDIDRLLAQGFTPEELEEYLYSGEL